MSFHNGTMMIAPNWRGKSNQLLTDLISYWTLDESSGVRYDRHAGNDLTDNNTVPSTTGKVGNAADLRGNPTNQEYLSVASNDSLNPGDSNFCFVGWVTTEDTSANVFLSKNNGASDNQWIIGNLSGELFARVYHDGTNFSTVTATTFGTLSTSTWYFFYLYHDSVNNEIGISVNNGTIDTQAHSTGVHSAAGDFVLGDWNGINLFWDGLLDSIGFWNRLLTSEELTFLYNSGNGRSYQEFN